MEDVKYELKVDRINYRNPYMGRTNVVDSINLTLDVSSTVNPEIKLNKNYLFQCDMEAFDRENFVDSGEITLDTVISWLINSDPDANTLEEVDTIKCGIEYIRNKVLHMSETNSDKPDWSYSN